ncbi:unnamed protein product, partial [marine sediment metagenome]
KELELAYKVNSKNCHLGTWLKRVDEVNGFRKEIPPYRVFFTWGMHYKCNYKCSLGITPEIHFSSHKSR